MNRILNLMGLFAILLVLVVSSTSVLAQPTLEAETQFGLSQTLAFGGVAADLGLEREEAAQLDGLWTQVEYKIVDVFRAYNNNFSSRFSDQRKAELRDELIEGIKEVRRYEQDQLKKVLSERQIDRLKQIRYQLINRKAENLTHLKDELDLSKKQIASLEDLVERRRKEVLQLRKDARAENLTRNEVADELKEIKKHYEEEFASVLSEGQRQQFAGLQGKKFEFR